MKLHLPRELVFPLLPRVLNGSGRVDPALKQKVVDAAAKLDMS